MDKAPAPADKWFVFPLDRVSNVSTIPSGVGFLRFYGFLPSTVY